MDDLEIRKDIVIPGWETWVTTSRSGGPGGQHANKTSTRVTLHWDLENTSVLSDVQRERVKRRLSSYVSAQGELQVTCDETRSQHKNRKLAQQRLIEMVREAVKKPKRRKKTRPPRSADRRRLENKRRRSQRKQLRKDPDIPRDW